jgi:hypothetical protein
VAETSEQLILTTTSPQPPTPSLPSVQIQNSAVGALAVTAGPVVQDVSQEGVSVENYWEPLRAELAELGVPDTDLDSLRTALEEDTKGADVDGPGGATRKWVASLGRKVADGALSVTVELVAALIKQRAGIGS